MKRVRIAAVTSPTVTAGSTMCCAQSSGSSVNGV